jgi:hypothetical protein
MDKHEDEFSLAWLLDGHSVTMKKKMEQKPLRDWGKGSFVAFDNSSDVLTEASRFFKRTCKIIIPSLAAKSWRRR